MTVHRQATNEWLSIGTSKSLEVTRNNDKDIKTLIIIIDNAANSNIPIATTILPRHWHKELCNDSTIATEITANIQIDIFAVVAIRISK